ncbi:Protein MIZU-KUSSEI 1 [Zea mays]|jgi:hypothetical protein|uniref:Protein MIZU-KUSSEI 1 n=2 Tax=Zea mays TaxID=4577 RepID=A0A1D6EM18_MAIZE|nr:Protein MIZU-KUSSEI 1 [Zea mays]
MTFSYACPSFHSDGFVSPPLKPAPSAQQQKAAAAGQRRRMKVWTAVSRLRSALANAVAGRHRQVGMGARLTDALYGHRRGHVHLAFQVDPRACPAQLLELAAPTAALVREMASDLVRIALECDRARGSPAAALPSLGIPMRRAEPEESKSCRAPGLVMWPCGWCHIDDIREISHGRARPREANATAELGTCVDAREPSGFDAHA